MKKNYITPEVEVIKVAAVSMLATSGEDVTDQNPPGSDVEDPFGGRDVNSRPGSGNVWDQSW